MRLRSKARAAENKFIDIGEKAGMDCADVTELIFPQRCNYFTKSVRPQKGAEALIG